jgi:hypothetical protein
MNNGILVFSIDVKLHNLVALTAKGRGTFRIPWS